MQKLIVLIIGTKLKIMKIIKILKILREFRYNVKNFKNIKKQKYGTNFLEKKKKYDVIYVMVIIMLHKFTKIVKMHGVS